MVLQLLAATEKTGQLEVRGENEEQRGFLGVSGGRLVSARFEDEDGYLALGAVFTIVSGDFEFLPQDRIDHVDLEGDVEELLERAAVERDRVRSIREVIANDRMRFRLSERATERGEITLAPQQWRALLLVDGQRDVEALAAELQMPRLAAQQLLAALVRAGLVDPIAPGGGQAGGEPSRGYRRLPPMSPIPPTTEGEQIVLRGRLPDFPLETILQLLAETKKTGRLEVRSGRDRSTIGMSDGSLVSAQSGEEEGEIALGAAFTAQEGEFDFVPMSDAPAANVSGALDPLLDRATDIRDRIVAIRALIPNERATFTLSERATRNPEIVLTPEQWRVLLGVSSERDVGGIADHLRMRRLPAMMALADLVRGGYLDVIPATEETWPYVERRKMPWPAPETVAAEPEAEGAPAPSPWEAIAEEEAVAEDEAGVAEEEISEEPAVEEPLAETPLDHEPVDDDRFAPVEGVFGAAEPAPPPAAWEPPPPETASPEAEAAAATAEAFASAPEVEPEPDPRLAAFGEQAAPPAWETPSSVTQQEPWDVVGTPVPAEPAPAEIDPRLAAFGAPPAQPEAPAWEAPAAEPAPVEAEPAAAEPAIDWTERARAEEIAAPPPPPAPAPVPAPEKKKGGLFGGLFGGAKAEPVRVAPAGSRAGQLATFANELVAAYNSGQYGKARVEDRMLNLTMRADEQAEPIDRPLPISNDRLDAGAIDRDGVPERQALPYLALLVREIYEEAERALGKDKARRGFRDVRDRLFGRDLTLFQAPEVSGRLPKV